MVWSVVVKMRRYAYGKVRVTSSVHVHLTDVIGFVLLVRTSEKLDGFVSNDLVVKVRRLRITANHIHVPGCAGV